MRNFKAILRKTVLFLLCVILLSVLFAELYFRGENYDYQDAVERDELAGQLTVLTTGASYVLFGVQPDILDETLSVRSCNVTGTLLTAAGRRELLKKELERNPVELVLLEVNPDTLTRNRAQEGPEGDLPILARLSNAKERFSYLKEAFSVSEYPMVYYDVVSRGIESGWRMLTGSYRKENREIVRGYYYNRRPDMELETDYADLYRLRKLSEEILPENVQELEDLIALCRENGAEVILITLPQSKMYNCMYANLDVFQTWISDFAEANDLPYFNFNLSRQKLDLLPDDGCFYDETHLNREGSERFTKLLGETIRDYLDGKNLTSRFYRDYAHLTRHSDYFG